MLERPREEAESLAEDGQDLVQKMLDDGLVGLVLFKQIIIRWGRGDGVHASDGIAVNGTDR